MAVVVFPTPPLRLVISSRTNFYLVPVACFGQSTPARALELDLLSYIPEIITLPFVGVPESSQGSDTPTDGNYSGQFVPDRIPA